MCFGKGFSDAPMRNCPIQKLVCATQASAPCSNRNGMPMSDGVTFEIVDPHQHFWDLSLNYYPWLCDPEPIPFRYGDYSALRCTYLPPDYRADAAAIKVVKTVHVEAEWDRRTPVEETLWLEQLARRQGLPNACVAHAALDAEDVEETLARQAAIALTRGIRHKPAASAAPGGARRGAPGSMDDPAWRRGYALLERHGLSFDLQAPWWHMDAAADLAADFAGTQIVINHTGLPSDRSAEGLQGWRAAMERVAGQSNVALKISGIGRAGLPWTVEANGPIVRDAISIFGVDRCMFASNFPVDSLVGSFTVIMNGFREAVAERPDADLDKLFKKNAERIYRL
jgi:predicted TIM-barrel fold metal-dependent hydrolase